MCLYLALILELKRSQSAASLRQTSDSRRTLFPVAPLVDSLNIVWVIFSPPPTHPSGIDMIRHDIGVIGKLLLTDAALAVLGHDLSIEQLAHLAVGAQFSVAAGMLRIVDAADSHLATMFLPGERFTSAAESRTVKRAELVSAKSHGFLRVGFCGFGRLASVGSADELESLQSCGLKPAFCRWMPCPHQTARDMERRMRGAQRPRSSSMGPISLARLETADSRLRIAEALICTHQWHLFQDTAWIRFPILLRLPDVCLSRTVCLGILLVNGRRVTANLPTALRLSGPLSSWHTSCTVRSESCCR